MLTLQNPLPIPADSIASLAAKAPTTKEEWTLLKSLPIEDLINQLCTRLVHFGIQLAIAILVFCVGKFLIGKIHIFVGNVLRRRKVDESLTTFLLSMVRILLYFILIVTVIGILGIETSSFIALFASAGVAIGMALSGTLKNFAGGVLILLLKPYKVGDYIEAQGYAGTVREIQKFSTIITTYDNKGIIIPNGPLSTSSINNWSREAYRREEWSVGISYGDDFIEAKAAILDILKAEEAVVAHNIIEDRQRRLAMQEQTEDEDDAQTETEEVAKKAGLFRRLFGRHHQAVQAKIEEHMQKRRMQSMEVVEESRREEHAPAVVLDALADSSVNLKVRAWVPTNQYWGVYYKVNELIYSELPKHGVSFPFPQMDVHVDYANSASANSGAPANN